MAVASKVSAGTPITAAWANSLVTEANNQPMGSGSFYDASGKTGKGYLLTSSGAWHISTSAHGTVTLNAGQIYVNNMLVKPENWSGTYNQRCSCSNFKDFEITQCTKETLPVFYIIVKMPVDVNPNNINRVSATLYKSYGEQPTPPQAPSLEEGETFSIIQLNEIKNFQIKQLVSGSIYLNFNSSTGGYDIQPISIVAGDGIKVDYSRNTYTIGTKISLIGKDNIIITNQQIETDGTLILEVGANIGDKKPVSLIAGDGIIVSSKEYNDVITYTISISPSIIPNDFDDEWFIVTDGTVTLNEAKLESEATNLAKSISSEIQTTTSAAIDTYSDCGREGDIMLEVVTQGESATARAWTD